MNPIVATCSAELLNSDVLSCLILHIQPLNLDIVRFGEHRFSIGATAVICSPWSARKKQLLPAYWMRKPTRRPYFRRSKHAGRSVEERRKARLMRLCMILPRRCTASSGAKVFWPARTMRLMRLPSASLGLCKQLDYLAGVKEVSVNNSRVLWFLALLPLFPLGLCAQQLGPDSVLTAMQQELDRSLQNLRQTPTPPFFCPTS